MSIACRKGSAVARDFFPFVEDGEVEGAGGGPEGFVVQHPARIAVYDDPSAAPRVVVVEPKDVRAYLEEITATVNVLVGVTEEEPAAEAEETVEVAEVETTEVEE